MYGYGGYGMGYGWFDPTMILLLIGMALSMLASAKVQSTFAAYSRVRSKTGMTGAQAAERILRSQGIDYVRVGHVRGNLTDHYDPKNKVLNLSDTVYNSTSVSAIGVAAHECGHAMQDAGGYVPLRVRGALVPVANFGAQISWPLILIGILFSSGSSSMLITLGILMFCAVVLFHLVTLPVELDASRRALRLLDENGILVEDEVKKTRKVLGAAALTYVAALAASILQLLRLLILFGGQRRNDD